MAASPFAADAGADRRAPEPGAPEDVAWAEAAAAYNA